MNVVVFLVLQGIQDTGLRPDNDEKKEKLYDILQSWPLVVNWSKIPVPLQAQCAACASPALYTRITGSSEGRHSSLCSHASFSEDKNIAPVQW